jgi:peroxiredoxin
MHTLLLLALFQAAPAVPAAQPLRSGCSPDDEQIASVSVADRIEVEAARDGGDGTCYKIIVMRPTGNLTGYVLGERLPAIGVFIHRRERADQQETESQLRMARQPVKAAAKDPDKPLETVASEPFEEFSGTASDGKAVSLSGLKGRAIVVCFWSPHSPRTIGPLLALNGLYTQFQSAGLEVVGVSMNPNPAAINNALDDFSIHWPQVADQSGLAKRYQVDPNAGKTFILDSAHRIVASGPMGPDLVKAIHQLLGVRDQPQHGRN